ncbi:MAG: NADP-reducing hydrogenase subunit HndC [Firmicutes bacterium ADurb.Bin506]|nr:MAG: NADP-reducing hydrogenase subunit HndC [Firmicutes bacterium ADurb.Bin506]
MEASCDHGYLQQVTSVASAYAGKPEDLLLALHDVQELRNYLPREALRIVAQVLKLPESRVCGVAGFYSMLSMTPRGRHIIRVCTSTSCRVSGAKKVVDSLLSELGVEMGDTTEDGAFTVEGSSCLGLCDIAPAMMIDSEVFGNLTPGDIRPILDSYIAGDLDDRSDPGSRPSLAPRALGVRMGTDASAPGQTRIVLENVGLINPGSIEDYIARDGYAALRSVLTTMNPSSVVDTVKHSGLRGRGGAAFPTGTKLGFTARAEADQKYVVCNADEGEPGTFKDRAIMEGDPHKVIEGMAIMGYAVGASRGYVYIRGEYPVSIERIEEAIRQARKAGFLGSGILGTAFDFDVEVKKGAGAYVCGEETALLESIEGKRGEPRQKPPYPGVAGLWGKPTVVCNVETIANIPPILLRGADWFKGIGTPTSAGTKVFALSGDVRNRGLVEVPMGVTLRELVYSVGGGIPGDRSLKAIQTGGASGGFLTGSDLDLKLDYDSLQPVGSTLGSGALLIVDDSHCMVDIICSILDFFAHESCGQCTPCREGAARLRHTFDKLRRFEATASELSLAMDLARAMRDSSLCALGQSPIVPLETIMKHFGDEIRGHLNGKCETGTCLAAEGRVAANA